MSALGTSEETKDLVPYYGAKWENEQQVQELGHPVRDLPAELRLRARRRHPADVRKLAKLAPVTPIIGSGRQRIQPIWADDVAEYFAEAVDRETTSTGQAVRARRPRRRQLERVLGAAEARPWACAARASTSRSA